MMDVSGSMGDEQKEIVRIETLLDRHLAAQASTRASRAATSSTTRSAREVDQRHLLPHARVGRHDDLSRPTSSAARSSTSDYPAERVEHLPVPLLRRRQLVCDDTLRCVELLKKKLLPRVNLFGYGQVESPYGSGQFIKDLREHFDERRARRHRARSATRDAIVGLDQGVPREGEIDAAVRTNTTPRATCATSQEQIESYARELRARLLRRSIFEVLDYDQMNEIAAYGGFPTRYPHWRFGMEYEQLAKSYEYGLSKIYEMVINNDPCYAYLLECNSHRRSEAGDGPRLRPLRLLQEQLLLRAHQPQDDRRDGQPRHARAPLHRQASAWRRSRSSSTAACRSRT